MILSHDKQFIFYHVPKTAGSSITTILAPYSIYKDKKIRVGEYSWQSDFHIDNRIHMKAKDNRDFLDYFKFAFIRHPYTRILSRWSKHRSKETSFESYILNRGFASDLIWNQKELLCDDQENLLVDFIGKFEYLQDDWNHICSRIDIPIKILPSVNTGERIQLEESKKYYTPEMKSIMLEVYKDEMKFFNYEW